MACAHPDGSVYATQDIPITSTAAQLKTALERDCPFLKGGITVDRVTSNWSTFNMGAEF